LKKVLSLVLVVVMMLGCIGFVACGGGEGETTPPPSNGETAPPSNGETTPPPSGVGLTWADIPVYPGANQIQEMTWTIPSEEGEWTKMEWRYYETGASVSAVATFYKSQMPGKGWQETFWMEVEEMQWGWYSKNNEQDGAIVSINSEEGKTFIALMRATE